VIYELHLRDTSKRWVPDDDDSLMRVFHRYMEIEKISTHANQIVERDTIANLYPHAFGLW
jgi:hypothetical protein